MNQTPGAKVKTQRYHPFESSLRIQQSQMPNEKYSLPNYQDDKLSP
jgi:hypothetical protein